MNQLLQFQPAIDRPDLTSSSITTLLQHWQGSVPVNEILVAEIDPAFAGGNDLCRRYGILPEEGAICVVIEAVRGANRTLAACVTPLNCKIDFNGIVRKTLNARKISMAPVQEVLKETQMEYGSITPIGLPNGWPILIDERLVKAPRVIVGAGLVKAKLALPGKALGELLGTLIIAGLAN